VNAAGRGITALVLRRCLGAAWPATLAVAAAALLLHRALPPVVDSAADAAGASAPWLFAPLFVAAIGTSLAALACWPLCAVDRPGADWARRLVRTPLQGTGAAIAGALLALWLLGAPLLLIGARCLGAPGQARDAVVLEAPAMPLLEPGSPPLPLLVPAGRTWSGLWLRPRAALPRADFAPSRVQVLADGAPLARVAPAFTQSGEFVRLDFAARPIATLELAITEGSVPLFFPTGSVELVGATARSGFGNALWASLVVLVPGFLALALAGLCGAVAGLPTTATVAVGTLFVLAAGRIGPLDDAVHAVLTGRWLPATAVFRGCLPSLAVGSAAMIGAMLLRRRPRR